MSRQLFEGIPHVHVLALEGGNFQVGVWDGADHQFYDLTEKQVCDAADLLCDLMDEAWPLDSRWIDLDDDGVTPNL